MKKYLAFLILFLSGCNLFQDTKLVDIKDIDGPCTIVLTDGTSVLTNGNIEMDKKTLAITYRDEDGKIWSVFKMTTQVILVNDYIRFHFLTNKH